MNKITYRFSLYLGVLFILLIIYHLSVWFIQESNLNFYSSVALVPIALLYFIAINKYRKNMLKIQYFNLIIHYITYIMVNGSFWVHAVLATIIRNNFILSYSWLGALLGMSFIWGIGLLVHTIVAFKQGGYDNVKF